FSVGPDEAHTGAARGCEELGFQRRALLAGLSEACAQDQCEGNFSGATLLHHSCDERGGHCDDGEIARAGKGGYVGIARQTFERLVLRVDRVNPTLEPELGQSVKRMTTDARRILGYT